MNFFVSLTINGFLFDKSNDANFKDNLKNSQQSLTYNKNIQEFPRTSKFAK